MLKIRRHIMSSFKKLSCSIWECKYHIVFCPKYIDNRIFDVQIGEYAKQQSVSIGPAEGFSTPFGNG